MCGIVGFFTSAGGARERERLVVMRDRMQSRGPDDCGAAELLDGRLQFGHRRLSVIDLSPAGHQPMTDSTGVLTIVYNGEIYNHPELREGLARDGFRFHSDSDTETILNLYLRDGRGALAQLRGMFAFALWDSRSNELLLARDTHGIKPLYYRPATGTGPGRGFAFASQVRALLADPDSSRRVDPAAAVGYAVWGAVPEPRTIVAGICALPAGHSLMVDADGIAQTPEPFLTLGDLMVRGAEAAPADPAAALRDSVSHHLLADVEVGCFLSAGVDSSAILALMRDAGADRVKAITLRFSEFEGTARDEAPLAAEIAHRYHAEHIVETIDADDFRASLPAIQAAMDQPSIDGVNSWFVSRAAARAGLKVVLSGLGGDELLAGYSTFQTVPRTHRATRILGRIPLLGALARAASSRLLPGKRGQVLDYARTLPGAYLARRSMLLPRDLGSVLPQHVIDAGLSRAGLLDPVAAVADGFTHPCTPLTISALESSFYMRNQLLRDSDWAGMAHSLEIRLPLVDVALSRTMAAHVARFGPGDGKRLLARAPLLPVPSAIVDRAKTGFGIPVERWIGGKAGTRLSEGWARQVLADYMAAERLSW
ncbi:asparagine synthase (glutamine-hydrolyzing) [Novosphingobium tardum]|uniref:asparagine synthase (glutamine-hydrolyzing) n=1 Tax=Novosphingobium tardum TaxID=1538021 RepID=A0ABV8RMS7_9SPHN